jgi:hypothetical protein
MIKRSKYGEETALLSIRVPISKKKEILNRFYRILNEYISGSENNPFVEIKENTNANVINKESKPVKTDRIQTLDYVYDCIEISKGIPDREYRTYINPKKDIAFTDKNDVDVYYAYWDYKYYKFFSKKEFDRFLKEKSV